MDDGIMRALTKLRDLLWGPPLVVLLLGTGIYLMILLRGLPIRRLFWAVRLSMGAAKNGGERGKTGVSAFSSLATELAATIGTGNVIGVVTAMMMGGPGALTWMMLSALIGLATKLVESTMSVHYRIRRRDGSFRGGPMITLSTAFPWPRAGKALAICYAIFAVACSLGMGNMVQANSIAVTLKDCMGWRTTLVGLVIAFLTLLSVLGGMKSIARISEWLVPLMGSLYVTGCLGILCLNFRNLPTALYDVFVGAFCPRAACGGLFGFATANWIQSLRVGVSRGIFSNEAGLGAGGISAAASSESNAIRQGWISTSAVFYDTLLICFLTGLAFACSGAAAQGSGNGAKMILKAFGDAYGRGGEILLAICITLFAFATILGWAAQGEAAFCHLVGDGSGKWYRFAYAIFTLVGACCALETIWTISDLANGLLAIPNLIALWVLGPGICKIIRKDPDGMT